MPIIALVVSFGLVLGMFGALGVTDMFNGPQTQVDDEVTSTAEEQNESTIDPNEAGEGGSLASPSAQSVRSRGSFIWSCSFHRRWLRSVSRGPSLEQPAMVHRS